MPESNSKIAAAASKAKPPVFLWQGVNRQGGKVKGEMAASQAALVRVQLRKQGITAKKIKKKPKALFGTDKKKITGEEMAAISRQLSTMINAGIPIAQSIEIIATGHENPTVRDMMNGIHTDIESGTNFSDALKKYPEHFNDLFCHLVRAGEQAGALDIMLDKIAVYREKAESVKSKIKKALFYPAAVITFSFLITAGLLIFIVPKFEAMFQNFGAELPLPTQIVVMFSEIFQAYWWAIFIGIGLAIWAFIRARRRSYKFARLVDAMMLKAPVFGSIFKKAAIARFSRTLATTFAAGLPLVEALNSVSGATGNILYAEATQHIREEVETGQRIQDVMRMYDLFPNMVVQMIAIGEESGSLELMLSKIADFYEQQVDDMVEGLSSLLEPIIMMVIGGLIGGIVIAMYLPIFQLGSVV